MITVWLMARKLCWRITRTYRKFVWSDISSFHSVFRQISSFIYISRKVNTQESFMKTLTTIRNIVSLKVRSSDLVSCRTLHSTTTLCYRKSQQSIDTAVNSLVPEWRNALSANHPSREYARREKHESLLV